MRFFNTAGPVNCERHYCLPPLSRIDRDEILLLLEQQKYFVLHYRLHTDEGKAVVTDGSAFNIKVESLRLGNFTRAEIEILLAQHTEETGQPFTPEAVALIGKLTQGQPWLVNALAYETCFKMKAGRDRSVSLTAAMVEEARERIIQRRETHLDQLTGKLREPRVRRVIGPQLLLQAFLQRIVNSGGRVEREYGLGRGRTDLLVIWPYGEAGGVQKVVIECKLLHRSLERTLAEGLEQTWAYMDRSGAEEGHLVIFDRDPEKPWAEKVFRREETHRGVHIQVWGM